MVDRTSVSVDEFEAFAGLPENADRRFELIDGEIIEMSPSELHGLVAGNLYAALRAYVLPRGLGRVVFEVHHRAPGDNRNARVPDVAFTTADRLLPVVERGSVPQMPDLAVEVKSPDDRYTELRKKAAYYLDRGVQLVWLAYPSKNLIEVYRPEADSEILTVEDTLDGGEVVPGFQIPVREVFEV